MDEIRAKGEPRLTLNASRHRFHSLCPYFAMFPEAFAEKWIERLTSKGDVVLDPFCGRGTAPFQALLMARNAVANDINPVAFCITKAKTNAPDFAGLVRRVDALERGYRQGEWKSAQAALPDFFAHAYAEETLPQILYLREKLRWRDMDVDCMLAALSLGALHGGGSTSYFSNQMPRTISTKPAYSIRFWLERGLAAPERDVFDGLRRSIHFRYRSEPPEGRAAVFNGDMRDLSGRAPLPSSPIRCVVTSPPYFDTTNYEEDQWLRLWFLGGLPRPTYRIVSSDDRHENKQAYWRLIADMWRMFASVLEDGSDVVLRIGFKGMGARALVEAVEASAVAARRPVRVVAWEVSDVIRRQTNSFRPGSKGLGSEVDCHFLLA